MAGAEGRWADCCTVTFSHQRAPAHRSGGSAVLFAVGSPSSPAAKGVLASLFVFSIHIVPKVTQVYAQATPPQNKGEDEVVKEQPHRGAGKHLFGQNVPCCAKA